MYFPTSNELFEGQEVDIKIENFLKIGIKVLINNKYPGILYYDEVFQELKKGDKKLGFIKHIRPDGKIDVSLKSKNYQTNLNLDKEKILNQLHEEGGFLAYNDSSHPEDIRRKFQMSKKKFKEAIGGLYKERLIKIEKKGIRLIS